MRIGFARSCLGIAVVLSAAPAHGQRAPEPTPPCAPCTVTFEAIVRLKPQSGHRFLPVAQAVRDTRGRFYVTHYDSARVVALFDSQGQYLRAVGTDERGVSHLADVMHVTLGPGDSLYALQSNLTIAVMSPDGDYVREVRLPFMPFQLRVLNDGRFLFNAGVATPKSAGFPLHIADPRTGDIIRSFGKAASPHLADGARRIITIASNGDIFATWPTRYLTERWDTSGVLVRQTERRAAWFEPWPSGPQDIEHVRPRPYQGNAVEEGAILWTLIGTARDDWRPATSTASPAQMGARLSPRERDRYVETRIEALDPGSAEVLGSLRVPTGSTFFLGNQLALHRDQLPTGEIVLDVVRVALIPGTPAEKRR